MREIILEKLKEIEDKNNVIILFAIESGSRGWGFSSSDSDYDVRFVYKHNPDWYLTIEENRDVIELPVNKILDINGWDIRKALRLSVKSNFVLWEWLQSPIVYIESDNFREKMLNVINNRFSPIGVAHAYLSLAKRTMETHYTKDTILIKKYFYIIRPLSSALWVIKNKTVPPMEFKDSLILFGDNKPFIKALDELMVKKANSTESDLCERIPEIDSVIDATLIKIENEIKELPKESCDLDIINKFYREVVK
jgi:uncharacterized protein